MSEEKKGDKRDVLKSRSRKKKSFKNRKKKGREAGV